MWRFALAWSVFATAAAAQTVTAARYDGPTDRYPHGVLGDTVTYTALSVTLSDGRTVSAQLPPDLVFEDTAPRLVDLDGDSAPEVIVVQSHQQFGAQLAIWAIVGDALRPVAVTAPIGARFRWLAVAGAADLDGDGTVEIAFVDRPHLAKELVIMRVWRDAAGWHLTEIARAPGLTNHRIGDRDIAGGIRACDNGRAVITASADWSQVVATTLRGGALVSARIGRNDGPAAMRAALACAPG